MDRSPAGFDPDIELMLGYVPASARGPLAALWALDGRLGAIVAQAREPAIGLMRLVWWRDRLDALGGGAPAEPLLRSLAGAGLDGPSLAAMVPGWEALLDDPDIDDATVALHATARGARLFRLAGAMLGADDGEGGRLSAAGEGWAMVDLARHLDRPARATGIREAARAPLDIAMARRWPLALRPLGALAALARADLGRRLGPRRRALRLLRHQLDGR